MAQHRGGADPELQNNAAALHAWYETFESQRKIAKDVIEAATQRNDFGSMGTAKYANADLHDALQTVTSDDLTSRRLGEWLSGMKDRPIGGFIVMQAGKRNGNLQWRVVKQGETMTNDEPEPAANDESSSRSPNDEIIETLLRQRV
jgi:hypothetical protein